MPPEGGVLFVHAHPDDECVATGGTIARLVAEGVAVDLVTCTDGAEGEIHDPTLDRTTNLAGAVAGMGLKEVREADAGYVFSRDGGKIYPYRGMGLRIPTLAEVLRECPGVVVNSGGARGPARTRCRRTGPGGLFPLRYRAAISQDLGGPNIDGGVEAGDGDLPSREQTPPGATPGS